MHDSDVELSVFVTRSVVIYKGTYIAPTWVDNKNMRICKILKVWDIDTSHTWHNKLDADVCRQFLINVLLQHKFVSVQGLHIIRHLEYFECRAVSCWTYVRQRRRIWYFYFLCNFYNMLCVAISCCIVHMSAYLCRATYVIET